MKKRLIVVLFLIGFLTSCNNTPKPIDYGNEGCHFCSMTIVDKQHASQFMTKKGRTYSFDAVECMMNYLKEVDNETISVMLVNDYNNPGEFVDATKATYLISKSIPSPMGEFLTAFSSKEAAETAQKENQGELFTYSELQLRFE